LLLAFHDEEAMFARAMSLGVRGCIVKEGATADIVNCLHAVRRGQSSTRRWPRLQSRPAGANCAQLDSVR